MEALRNNIKHYKVLGTPACTVEKSHSPSSHLFALKALVHHNHLGALGRTYHPPQHPYGDMIGAAVIPGLSSRTLHTLTENHDIKTLPVVKCSQRREAAKTGKSMPAFATAWLFGTFFQALTAPTLAQKYKP